MLQKDTLDYVIKLRRELHEYPEIGFDLPRTLAVVCRELDAMGISYTVEEFGRSSIVATINPQCQGFTIGIRGDMDALPIQEENCVPYASKLPGQMHACGHDAHTAMLLGTARELKAREGELRCRVKLLFTPAEEYITPGCKELAENGVMDDIDCAIGCHVSPRQPSGKISLGVGGMNANSMGFTAEFFGTSSHAAYQHKGHDAIAMAVEAYVAMETMVAKEFLPTEPRLLNIGRIQGGQTNNIVCNYCELFGSARAFDDDVSEKLITRIREICEGVAKMSGGEAKVTVNKFLPYVLNNETVTQRLHSSAAKILGEENVVEHSRGMGGEDFGFLSRKKPCAFFHLGTCKDEATANVLHTVNFNVDEDALQNGVKIFLQFVLDNMDGFPL